MIICFYSSYMLKDFRFKTYLFIAIAILVILALIYILIFQIFFKTSFSSCAILDEKYCKTGKLVIASNGVAIGFKLPVGSAIYSPFDGTSVGLSDDMALGNKTYKIFEIEHYSGSKIDENSVRFSVISLLDSTNTNIYVKKGDPLAIIKLDSEISGLKGNYNVVMYFSKFDKEKRYFLPDNNGNLLKKFFGDVN